MIREAGADILSRWQLDDDSHHLGLQNTNPLAHELAQPLFDADVTSIYLTRRIGYKGAPNIKTRYHNVVIVLEGTLQFSIGRRKKLVGPGMIYAVPGGSIHNRLVQTNEVSWILFQLAPVPRWKPMESAGAYVRDYESADCMRVLVNHLMYAYEIDGIVEKRTAPGLAEAILALLKQELHMQDFRPSKHTTMLEELHDRIRANPADDWTLERMISDTGMTVRTLTRHCQRVYGTSPLELVHRQRLRIAYDLIKSDMSLENVSKVLGYRGPDSFSNMFYRHMGMRPGEFQKLERGQMT